MSTRTVAARKWRRDDTLARIGQGAQDREDMMFRARGVTLLARGVHLPFLAGWMNTATNDELRQAAKELARGNSFKAHRRIVERVADNNKALSQGLSHPFILDEVYMLKGKAKVMDLGLTYGMMQEITCTWGSHMSDEKVSLDEFLRRVAMGHWWASGKGWSVVGKDDLTTALALAHLIEDATRDEPVTFAICDLPPRQCGRSWTCARFLVHSPCRRCKGFWQTTERSSCSSARRVECHWPSL